MEKQLEILHHNRKIFNRFLKSFSLEQLNKIPKGFNNNIFWNVAHCLVTLQRLVYIRSGLPTGVPQKWFNAYKKGTAPNGKITETDVEELIVLFHTTFDQLVSDCSKGVFKTYEPYTTSTNMELSSVEDALTFSLFHEGIHVGSVLALAKHV
ncbi:MAG: DinB family protein [Flavobacteriaceae bacterium]